jgi:hypothetical protein
MKKISKKNEHHFSSNTIYPVSIHNEDILLPLLYPESGNFFYVCLQGYTTGTTPQLSTTILKIEKEIMNFSMKNKIRRYAQSEFLPKGTDYKKYFGEKTFADFIKNKRLLDPQMLFSF